VFLGSESNSYYDVSSTSVKLTADVTVGGNKQTLTTTVTYQGLANVTVYAAPNWWNVIGVESTVAGTRTDVYGNTSSTEGYDQFILGDNADTLDHFAGDLHVHGGSASRYSFVSMNDLFKTNYAYTLTSSTLTRSGAVPMNPIYYDGMNQFVVAISELGSNDAMNVLSTAAGTYTVVATGGGDTVTVGNPLPSQPGRRTLAGIQGFLRVQSVGSDHVALDDSGDPSGRQVSLSYDGNNNDWSYGETVHGLAPADILLPEGADTGVLLRGGTGNNSFALQNAPGGMKVFIDGGSGSNWLDYSAYTTGVSVNLWNGTATDLAGVRNIQNVAGGTGNDLLIGGGTNDILVGGGGNDYLQGGLGRNVLIAGNGQATLVGGPQDDLLIGGYTAYDTQAVAGGFAHHVNYDALDAVMAQWGSSAGFAQRVQALRGVLGDTGPSATVVDAAFADTLTGNPGRDWFFARGQDRVTDFLADPNSGDVLN
jgi:Ca2+-binding RTX toxin-like protein